jgi:hypothetical protein
MNGRVYDPFVARFLSPDPFVQNANSTQGFNRYSYVSNNPLKFTDPSGYQHGNHPMTAANYITVNNAAYELVGGGAIGPMHGNYWSNAYGFGGYGGYGSSGGNGGHYSNDNSGFIPIYTNNSSGGAYYNQNNGLYYTADGMIISAQQAQNGYANYSLEVSWLFFSGTNANPYQTFIGAQFNNGKTTWFYQQATSDHNGSLSREGQAGGGVNDGLTLNEVATGVGAFSLANGVKGNLVEWGMKGADWGNAGARYVKYVKGLGYVGAGLTTTYTIGTTGVYYYNGGTDWQVGAKATLDVVMTGAAFFWPIGTAVSGAYFILDVSTGGFGGFGEIKP